MTKHEFKQGRNTQSWQSKQNYHRVYDQNGKVAANIITVDGVDVEVTEEVFLVYSQMDRRERYVELEVELGRKISLDKLLEDGASLEMLGSCCVPSAEEYCLESEDAAIRDKRLKMVRPILDALTEAERELITALYIKNISAREYGRMLGVSDMAIHKRRNRILKKLKNFFD